MCCSAFAAHSSDGAGDLVLRELAVETLPEGCGNPFADMPLFMNFFDNAIAHMVAKRGPTAKGVVDLFAVAEMRDRLTELAVNPQTESPIDRLILSQLCLYERVATQKHLSGKGPGGKIQASDDSLHDHLASIAPKLYKDTRTLVVEALAARAREREKENALASKWADIRRAHQLGADKIRDLFD
jgi:hypothetical protein